MSGNETWTSVAPPRTFAFKVKAAEPTYFKRQHFYCKGSLCSILHSFTIASWVVDKTWSVCKPGGDFRANSVPNRPSILLQPASPSNSNLQQPFANLGKHIFPIVNGSYKGVTGLSNGFHSDCPQQAKDPPVQDQEEIPCGLHQDEYPAQSNVQHCPLWKPLVNNGRA